MRVANKHRSLLSNAHAWQNGTRLNPSGGGLDGSHAARMHWKLGAGEGNRTLVCSLGSWQFPKDCLSLAAKPGDSVPNPVNGLQAKSKTLARA